MADGEETPKVRHLRPSAPAAEVTAVKANPDPGSTEHDTKRADPKPADGKPDQAKPAGAESNDSKPAAAALAPDVASAADSAAGGRRRRVRVPFAHAVRRIPPPRQAAVATGRAVRAWSRRPSGRLALPALMLLALVAATGAAGAILVPATASTPRVAASPTATDAGAQWPVPLDPDLSPGPVTPTGSPSALPTGGTSGRSVDMLASWAQQIGSRINVSPIAMQAYGYAELALARTTPSCRLSWTTLAAIGSVESNHGQHNNAQLQPNGEALPKIFGPPLTGTGGTQKIMDTDRGLLDGDTTYDRAVGPMQFIPTTWQSNGADADNDGAKDPHNINDAALAAGNYLCTGGRDLSTARDWWNAILSYNDVRAYAQSVFDTANRYGIASRT